MIRMFRGLLEYFRVLFLFLILAGAFTSLVARLQNIYQVNLPDWLSLVLAVFFSVLFAWWYHNMGKNTGWLASKNK